MALRRCAVCRASSCRCGFRFGPTLTDRAAGFLRACRWGAGPVRSYLGAFLKLIRNLSSDGSPILDRETPRGIHPSAKWRPEAAARPEAVLVRREGRVRPDLFPLHLMECKPLKVGDVLLGWPGRRQLRRAHRIHRNRKRPSSKGLSTDLPRLWNGQPYSSQPV